MHLSVFLFAAIVSASTHFERQDDPSTTYRVAIASIAQDVQNYFTQVTTFSGASSKTAFLDAISQLEDTVSGSIATVQSQPSLDEEDTMVVSIEILNLDNSVQEAITTTTDRKSVFAASCLGPTILQFLQTEQTAFANFVSKISTKVDPSFQDIMNNVHDDFFSALQTGIDAFADQTTLPASCVSTITSSATSSSTTTSSAATSSTTSSTSSTATTTSSTTTSSISSTITIRTSTSTSTSTSTKPSSMTTSKCTQTTSSSMTTRTSSVSRKISTTKPHHHHAKPTRKPHPYEYRRKPYTGW